MSTASKIAMGPGKRGGFCDKYWPSAYCPTRRLLSAPTHINSNPKTHAPSGNGVTIV